MEELFEEHVDTDIKLEDIAEKMQVAKGTIGIYFARDEFNYLIKIKDSYRVYYRNVSEKTYKQLNKLIRRKKGGYTY